jgi:ankyrin repeat protein
MSNIANNIHERIPSFRAFCLLKASESFTYEELKNNLENGYFMMGTNLSQFDQPTQIIHEAFQSLRETYLRADSAFEEFSSKRIVAFLNFFNLVNYDQFDQTGLLTGMKTNLFSLHHQIQRPGSEEKKSKLISNYVSFLLTMAILTEQTDLFFEIYKILHPLLQSHKNVLGEAFASGNKKVSTELLFRLYPPSSVQYFKNEEFKRTLLFAFKRAIQEGHFIYFFSIIDDTKVNLSSEFLLALDRMIEQFGSEDDRTFIRKELSKASQTVYTFKKDRSKQSPVKKLNVKESDYFLEFKSILNDVVKLVDERKGISIELIKDLIIGLEFLRQEKTTLALEDHKKLLKILFRSQAWDKMRPLMESRVRKHLKIFEKSQSETEQIKAISNFLGTALSIAVFTSSEEAYRVLLYIGLSYGDAKESATLACALHERSLLDQFMKIFDSAFNVDLLQIAIQYGHMDIFKDLIMGTPINTRFSNESLSFGLGCTPLGLAAANGNLDMVRFLVEKGAIINVNDLIPESEDLPHNILSPLDQALRGENMEVYEFLLSKGALSNLHYHQLLGLAALHNHIELVKQLLALNQDPFMINRPIKGNQTALIFAIKGGHCEMVKLLIAHGANIFLGPSITDEPTDEPLVVAAAQKNVEVLSYLFFASLEKIREALKHSSNSSELITFHQTLEQEALKAAHKNGRKKNLQFLIDNRAYGYWNFKS